MDGLTIGKLARKSGVNVETIRFYERKGLINQPEKPPEGYRRYPAEAGVRVRFIRNAKELGFSLREIKELLTLAGTSKVNRKGMRAKAEAKIVEACRTGKKACRCPIVEVFEHRGEGKRPSTAKGKE